MTVTDFSGLVSKNNSMLCIKEKKNEKKNKNKMKEIQRYMATKVWVF